MSLELIKTTMEDTYYEMEDIRTRGGQEYEVLFDVFHDWQGGVGESVFLEMCPNHIDAHHSYFAEYDRFEAEVLDKMIVSYITGKTRTLQRWFRSFEELPMACPCPE